MIHSFRLPGHLNLTGATESEARLGRAMDGAGDALRPYITALLKMDPAIQGRAFQRY
jgi:hypothetical protein